MSILIGGDLAPTKSNEELFKNGNKISLMGVGLSKLMEQSAYRIFNLETPITDHTAKINKAGPALQAHSRTINGVKSIGTDLLTLANNHIMDQGSAGLYSTIALLEQNGISYVGAGENAQKASAPFYFEQNGTKYGVIACAEHEFSIADDRTPGAYGFDPVDTFDFIQDTKSTCDFLIILYHGGKEYYRYPSPYLQKICRKMIEKGADLVLCQHSHCIGCEEKYRLGTIVYGQGNFLFALQHNEFWHSGLIVRITDENKIEYIPIVQKDNAVQLAEGQEAEAILKGFYERSAEILQPGFIENKYKEFAAAKREFYLVTLFAQNRRSVVFRALNRLTNGGFTTWRINKRYTLERITTIRNFIECEAHRELLLKGIEEETNAGN